MVSLGDSQQMQLNDFFRSFEDIFEIHLVDHKPNFSIRMSNLPLLDDDGNDVDLFGLDLDSAFRASLLDQIKMELYKKPLSDAFLNPSDKVDLSSLINIERRESRLSKILDKKRRSRSRSAHEIFNDLIMENNLFGYERGKYIVTNSKISSFFQDYIDCIPSKNNSFPLIDVGTFKDIKLYSDSFMRFDDDRLAIFSDKIKLFVSKPVIVNESSRSMASIYRDCILPEVKVLDFKGSNFDFLI
ncbi:MAG: hypothetical protein SLAVMIC_01043 [uncultured marine phage]|uniref:Uncharacterized protein n=1 Tax=uncultured marine phage TaxID=707152 RepID=A0A8D9CG62_9VIRU|nr:MAG: hypothetical protein SLAVMIC_01043 [uncultured marine phage]